MIASASTVRPLALSSWAVWASPKAIQSAMMLPSGRSAPATGARQLSGISVLHAFGVVTIGGAPTQATQSSIAQSGIDRRVRARGSPYRMVVFPGDGVSAGIRFHAVADGV